MGIAPTNSSEPPLDGWCVLYVDDDRFMRRGMGRLLRGAGAICLLAGTHVDAVTFLDAEEEINLAILDYQMPDGDVAWLVRRLRHSRPDLTILGTSGADRCADFSCRGVSHFLQKPFNVDDVIWSCASLLPARGVRRSTELAAECRPRRVPECEGES